jgi:5-methylcytosine-specific restriction endonuclease McrBC regulatory subunit McrC
VPSFFIDMAELWENYLLAVLKRHLPDYEVVSPNSSGGDWLLEGQKRSIRPDLLIRRKSSKQIAAVLDAKFKSYTQIGAYEKGGVSRADLYQMGTYLYHYSSPGQPMLGLFVSPVSGEAKASVETLKSNPRHRLGVATFDVSRWDEIVEGSAIPNDEIRDAERAFARAIEEELEKYHGSGNL